MGRFPFFYSYLGCGFCGTVALFLIFRFRHHAYPYAYWLYFLLGIVVEFAVLVGDFRPPVCAFPRNSPTWARPDYHHFICPRPYVYLAGDLVFLRHA